MKKTHVSGLTTAAGLWVTGAIGMGAGCGLYLMSGVCTFLVLFCLEVLNAYAIKFGQREVDVVLSSDSELSLMDAVQALGKEAGHFHIYKENGLYKVAINMRVAKRETPLELMKRLKELKDVALDSME